MTDLHEEIGEIVEAVFNHGKYTPNGGMNLPKGQMTIAEAVNKLEKIVEREKEVL